MATTTVNYSGNTTITLTAANSLASDANLIAGAESTEIDNTTNKYMDALVQGKIAVHASVALTASKSINVYVWGSHTSLATTARNVLDGADSAETFTNSGQRDSLLRWLATINPATTAGLVYEFGPVSVAARFGGVMPKYWGLWVVQDTGQALAASGHEFVFNGIKYDVA